MLTAFLRQFDYFLAGIHHVIGDAVFHIAVGINFDSRCAVILFVFTNSVIIRLFSLCDATVVLYNRIYRICHVT